MLGKAWSLIFISLVKRVGVGGVDVPDGWDGTGRDEKSRDSAREGVSSKVGKVYIK